MNKQVNESNPFGATSIDGREPYVPHGYVYCNGFPFGFRWYDLPIMRPYIPLVSTNAPLLDKNNKHFPEESWDTAVYYFEGKWNLSTPEFWERVNKKYPPEVI